VQSFHVWFFIQQRFLATGAHCNNACSGGRLSPPVCVCDSTRAHTVTAVPRIAATAGHLLCRGQVSCGSRSRRCVPQQSAVFAGGLARRHSLSQPEVCAAAAALARWSLPTKSLQPLPLATCQALPPVAVLLSLAFRTRRLEPESHIIMTSSSARARQTRITTNNN
jgi:hypothetical protein